MMGKIDFRAVVKDHFATLADEDSNTRSSMDFVLFYLVPIIVGVVLVKSNLIFGKAMGNVLITALAIFAGLLLNLLLQIFDIANKPRPESEKLSANKIRFLKEIYSNIAYAILMSLLTIVVLLIHFGFSSLNLKVGLHVSALLVYVMCGNLVLTLLMVLKRVHVLLVTEFHAT